MGMAQRAQPRTRERALPRWIPVVLIGLLIFGGLGLIGLGLVSDAGEQETATDQNAGNRPALQQGQAGKPEANAQEPQPAAPPAAAAGIDRQTFGRFELGVPSGWRSGERDGGTFVAAPGDKAETLVLFGSQQPAGSLGSVAGEVLRNQYPGARVSGPKPTRVGGLRAMRVNGVFRGDQVSAVALNAGVTYVLTQRVVRRAPAAIRAQAAAVIQSFRPL
jgi:hypothetical protein